MFHRRITAVGRPPPPPVRQGAWPMAYFRPLCRPPLLQNLPPLLFAILPVSATPVGALATRPLVNRHSLALRPARPKRVPAVPRRRPAPAGAFGNFGRKGEASASTVRVRPNRLVRMLRPY